MRPIEIVLLALLLAMAGYSAVMGLQALRMGRYYVLVSALVVWFLGAYSVASLALPAPDDEPSPEAAPTENERRSGPVGAAACAFGALLLFRPRVAALSRLPGICCAPGAGWS